MPTMKAAVLYAVGDDLRVGEATRPKPGSGEALVSVRAAALNHRDVWIRRGEYAGLKFPIVLGSDGAGTVTEVGPDADSSWVGREVVINPALAWGGAPRAQGADFRILGLPDDGTLAEYVRVPVENLFARPEHLSWHEAAALPLAGLTAYRAVVTQGRIESGQNVLVTGVGGGAASFALQFAVARGGRVFVTSGSDEKLAAARELGAAGGANYHAPNWAQDLQSQAGAGFDLVIDSAGGDGFGQLVEAAAPGGRIVFFGATLGSPPALDLRRIFWKQLTLQGTTMGTPEDFRAMLGMVREKSLRPVVDRVFPFTQVNDAFAHMEGAAQFGKIVVNVTEGKGTTDA